MDPGLGEERENKGKNYSSKFATERISICYCKSARRILAEHLDRKQTGRGRFRHSTHHCLKLSFCSFLVSHPRR